MGTRDEVALEAAEAPVNILMVDDHPENLVALRGILASPDYRLIQAGSGEEALGLLQRAEVALVLLDVVMPGLDGFMVADRMKEEERTRHVPIVFLTAVATDCERVWRAYSAGAVDYLIKPLDARAVRAKVAVFADLFRHRRQLVRKEELLREAERREHALQVAELRVASDRRYRKLVEGIDHAVAWTADAETLQLSFMSRQAEVILGYDPGQLPPDFWLDHVHPEDRQLLVAAFSQAVVKREDVVCDHRLVARDGRVMWFHTCVSSEDGTEDAPAQLHGISVDISELKRVESNQRLLARVSSVLCECLDAPSMLRAIAGSVVPELADWCLVEHGREGGRRELAAAHTDRTLDPAIERACGPVDPDGPEGVALVRRTGEPQVWMEPVEPERLARAIGAEPELVRHLGQPGSCLFLPLRAHDRVLGVLTLVNAAPRRFAPGSLALAGDVAGRAGLALENAVAYAAAREAARVRDELVARVSHDLRNPLGAAVLYSHRLTKTFKAQPLPDAHLDLAERLERVLRRMERMVGELLEVDRIERKWVALHRKPEEPLSLVREVVETVEPLAREKCVDIDVMVDHALDMSVSCDRERVLSILGNLLENALRFSPGGARITVRAERRGSDLQFAVSDMGPGIPPDDLPRLFDKFWPGQRERDGTGLGLIIAKGHVEAHGGRMWVESELGKGTTIKLTLPLETVS